MDSHRRIRSLTFLPRAVIAVWLSSCSPGAPTTRDSLRSVLGGTPDSLHSGVVAVVVGQPSMPLNLCSGFLIQPRLAITAAHCVFGRAAADLRVVDGSSIAAPQQTIDVAEITTYPRFKGLSADAREANDLAVLTLSVDATGVPIAYDRNVTETGQAIEELVGFGLSDPNDSSTSGTRRAVVVTTTAVCDRLASFGDGVISACVGDSGGPLLASDSTGSAKAVAIVSFGSDAQCGAPVYALRLAPFAPWLDTVISGHADSQCSSSCAPAQTSCLPGPPPDSQAGCRIVLSRHSNETSVTLVFFATLWVLRRARRCSAAHSDVRRGRASR